MLKKNTDECFRTNIVFCERKILIHINIYNQVFIYCRTLLRVYNEKQMFHIKRHQVYASKKIRIHIWFNRKVVRSFVLYKFNGHKCGKKTVHMLMDTLNK